jgi:hypothetical protein
VAASFKSIDCRSYTRARRHPLVIGKIGGWTLPTPISPTQLLILLGTFLALLWTRALWAHLGGVGNLIVQGFVPLLLAWMVRYLRVEGRPPLRALTDLARYLTAPRGGVLRGRSLHERPAIRLRGGRFFMEED